MPDIPDPEQFDDSEDEEQPVGGRDPVAIMSRALDSDRSQGQDDADGGGMGALFSRIAGGPRIKAPQFVPPDTNGGKEGGDDETFRTGEGSKAWSSPQPIVPPDPSESGKAALAGKYTGFGSSDDSTPDAINALGEYAAATGDTGAPTQSPPDHSSYVKDSSGLMVPPNTTTAKPPTTTTPTPSHLSQVPAAPAPPSMPADYAASQADLRAKSTPTAKYDPVTGKTLDQYKIGAGGRIARALEDFGKGVLEGRGVMGGASNVVQGAFGDKSAPGYYGRGAVNSQYAKDEQDRQNAITADKSRIASYEDQQKQAQQEWTDQNKVREDSLKTAYEQDTNEQKAKYQKDTTDLKQQAEDLKEQLRTITYDPKTKQFMHNDAVYTPKNVEEGAILETQHGVQNGPYRQMWDKERRNQPISVHTGGDKGFSARDILKIKSYAKSNGIKLKSTSPDDISDAMTDQQVDEALGNKYVDPGDQMLRGDALKNFKADTEVQNIDGEMKKLESDRSLYTQGLGSDDPNLKKQSQDSLKGIDQRIADLTTKRNARRDYYVEQQNKRQPSGAPAATPAPAPAAQPPKAAATRPVQTSGNKPPTAQPKLTPIPDKSMKTAGGKTYNIGDDVPGRGKIKSFSRGEDGKTYANF